MFKLSFTAAFALAAASATAQSGGTSAQPAPAQPAPAQPAPSGQAAPAAADNPIPPAAMAFGQCVQGGIQGVAASVAPEAGATQVLGACATQRQQLEQAVETVIANLPDEQKTAARTQLQSRLAQAQTEVAAVIRQQRTAAPPAAPTE